MTKIVKQLFENIATYSINSYNAMIPIWSLDTLQQCQFVVTGLIDGDNRVTNRIGYLVQVRLHSSCFNSEVLLRLADGSISVNSNQTYYKINNENTCILMEYFKILPCFDLLNTEGYTIGNKYLEHDFIVRHYE